MVEQEQCQPEVRKVCENVDIRNSEPECREVEKVVQKEVILILFLRLRHNLHSFHVGRNFPDIPTNIVYLQVCEEVEVPNCKNVEREHCELVTREKCTAVTEEIPFEVSLIRI